jgi:hypothetical protein
MVLISVDPSGTIPNSPRIHSEFIVACLNWVDDDWSYPRRPCVLPHVRKDESWIPNVYTWLSSI